VITFDDGYADNLHTARPLLATSGLPATVFVATGSLGAEFWWDTLARLIFSPALLPETLAMTIGGQAVAWSQNGAGRVQVNKKPPGARERLLPLLYEPLQALPPEERESVLARLRDWVASASPPRPVNARAMTPAEVQALADGGLITVGAHSVSHEPLATLPPVAQQEQIAASKATLTDILGQPVRSFSYPHGAASAATRQFVRECGFQLACASHNDTVRTASNPFHLPRFWIQDWNGDRFGRWLRGWLQGWKNS
jgi:peptidoglycan/xylan/chitin deacetylase (PgdA/CDA1 family)